MVITKVIVVIIMIIFNDNNNYFIRVKPSNTGSGFKSVSIPLTLMATGLKMAYSSR